MTVFTWAGERDTMMSPLDSIKYYKLIIQTGFMAMDPKTGHIKAWVGGPAFKYFKYDHVNIKAKRQVGSTFKPFIYAIAMDNGWPPCKELTDAPVVFEKYDNWSPRNAEKKFSLNKYTLKKGLAKSMNSITAQIMREFGPHAVLNLIRRVGITSEVLPVPSICLGTPDISVYELTGAYSVFANKGIRTKPIYLTKITDKNGNIIQEFNTEKQEALNEQTAYLMVHLLQNVVRTNTRIGSEYNLYNDIGGKTGTTQNHSDGWFIGFTPELVAGTWVGWNDRIFHFRNIRLGQGAHMALPIWALFMQKVLNDETLGYSKKARFTRPSNLTVELDCDKYQQKKENKIGFGTSY
jgi:penicillin-binding protein 1A